MLGEEDSKKGVAFLKKSSAKNFCNFYTGFFNVPRTRGTKGTPWDS
jgi:hypothetical protein